MAPAKLEVAGDTILCKTLDVIPTEIQREKSVGSTAMSPNDFRANFAVSWGGERSGACSMEAPQEGLIAMLLRQQHEMLRELQDQKKEIQLSQASKKEIRQLILSTIKEHLQPGHEAPSPVDLLVGRPRVKRVKHGRRRCNPGHRTKDGQVNNSAGGEGFCEQRAKHYPNGSRSPQLPQENPCCHDDATIIRQRVELQAPQLEVSLDGRWLPSLPSFSPLSSGLSQQHQGLSPPWDTSCKDATSATFLETHLSIDGDKGRFRPSTVAQVASAINSKAIPTTGSGPCAVRDGECRDTVHVQKPSTTSTSQLCKRLGDETEGGHRGSTRSSGESATRHHCHGQGKGWCEGSSEAAAISQHAAIMLERSRALVARAKELRISNESMCPNCFLITRTMMDLVGQACCGHIARSTPYDEGKGGSEQRRSDLGTCSRRLSLYEFGPGQTQSILFPPLSPAVIDDGTSEELRDAPLAFSAKKCFQLTSGGDRDDLSEEKHGIFDLQIREEEEEAIDANGEAHVLGMFEKSSVEHHATEAEDAPLARPSKAEEHHCGPQTRRHSQDLCGSHGVLTTVSEPVATTQIDGIAPALNESSNGYPPLVETKEIKAIDRTQTRPAAVAREAGSNPSKDEQMEGERPRAVAVFTGKDGVRLRRSGDRREKHGDGEGEIGCVDNPAKVDTEWENEIAKNILSLYQTKLKAELTEKRGDMEEKNTRKPGGYLTAEEDETLDEQNVQRARRPSPRRLNHGSSANEITCHGSSSLTASSPLRNRNDCPETFTVRSQKGVKDVCDPSAPRQAPYRHDGDSGGSKKERGCGEKGTETRMLGGARPMPERGVLDANGREPRMLSSARGRRAENNSAGRAREEYPHSRRRPSTVPAFASTKTAAIDGMDTARNAPSTAGAGAKGRGGFRGARAISVPTRGSGEVVVIVPKRPNPIWFAGSGAVQAEWSALPGGALVVRDLEELEEQGRYSKYVAVVEGLLAAHLRADDQRGPTELVKRLWRQLVVTCTAFGVRSTENRRFERGLELLKRADTLLSRQLLDKQVTSELRAFVFDAYGFYYLRRGKSTAALNYVQKAMMTHARMQDSGHVTKCHLHSAVVLSRLNRHDEALRCLGQVLAMVQEGKLDVGGNSPQKLCLVAICYHNIAVEQLIMRHVGEACLSSQNARRLARLCLSYSNRWLHSFEGTHKLALAELARALPSTSGGGGRGGRRGKKDGDDSEGSEQRELLRRLTQQLFS